MIGCDFDTVATRRNREGETHMCSFKNLEKLPDEEKLSSSATDVRGSSRNTSRRTTSSTLTALQNTAAWC